MSRHTPGPWEITRLLPPYTEGEGNDYSGAEISWYENVPSRHHHDAAVTIWSENAEADARLISAAPDLLEACRQAREQLIALTSEDDVPDAVNDAIAKAEGR